MGKGDHGQLTRSLGLRHVFALSTGAMLSSGLFLLPGLAAAKAGPAAVLAYLLAGLLAVPAMLSVSELATALPKAGGAYYSWSGRWARRSARWPDSGHGCRWCSRTPSPWSA